MSESLQHTVRVPLRWRDMDMLGHLNQSVYHELLEEVLARRASSSAVWKAASSR